MEGKQTRIIPPIREWNKSKKTKKYKGEENILDSLKTPIIYGNIEDSESVIGEKPEESPFPLSENWAEEMPVTQIEESPSPLSENWVEEIPATQIEESPSSLSENLAEEIPTTQIEEESPNNEN